MQKEIGWLLQEKYNGKLTPAAKKDIKRLKSGEPLDHLIGFVEFLGCKILVDKNVLIPRFETEFWVQEAIDELSSYKVNKVCKVLDMFAGSGAIGIAVLKHARNTHTVCVFAESEKEAVAQIKKNCDINKIPKSRYHIIQSDIFSNIQGRFDVIFANPPYIPTARKHKVQTSVLKYEPKEALFGGPDGLSFVTRFLTEAKDFLSPGGKIYMEFDTMQRHKINILLKKLRYKTWQFHKDQYGRFRWVAVAN